MAIRVIIYNQSKIRNKRDEHLDSLIFVQQIQFIFAIKTTVYVYNLHLPFRINFIICHLKKKKKKVNCLYMCLTHSYTWYNYGVS